jgi:predicted small lipoprotein YifL
MRRLRIGLLALVLLAGACGRYGPPLRPHTPAPAQEEEKERQEQTTP